MCTFSSQFVQYRILSKVFKLKNIWGSVWILLMDYWRVCMVIVFYVLVVWHLFLMTEWRTFTGRMRQQRNRMTAVQSTPRLKVQLPTSLSHVHPWLRLIFSCLCHLKCSLSVSSNSLNAFFGRQYFAMCSTNETDSSPIFLLGSSACTGLSLGHPSSPHPANLRHLQSLMVFFLTGLNIVFNPVFSYFTSILDPWQHMR